MQMEVSLKQEVKQEVTLEVSSEIQIEYQNYQKTANSPVFDQISWNSKDLQIIEGARKIDKPKIMTAHTLCKSLNYQKPYHQLFAKSDLLVSENFAHTETHLLPIFSIKQKSADQILIKEESGKLKAILLSAEEGVFFKKQIQNGLENTWLYLPDGHMHAEPYQGRRPKDTKKLGQILWEANLFNGNAGYLLKHKEETIANIGTRPDLKELLLRFLAVKNQKKALQQGALERLALELSLPKWIPS
jgi:hypothetical protein